MYGPIPLRIGRASVHKIREYFKKEGTVEVTLQRGDKTINTDMKLVPTI